MANANDAPGAAPSDGRQNIPYGLLSVDEILAHTKYRAEHRDNVEVGAAADLGLHYRHPEAGEKGGFYATVPVRNKDGEVVMKPLPLSHTGVKTACSLIGAPAKFFAQGEDPDFFPKTFSHIMDAQSRRSRGMLLRHDGLQVNAILPRNYLVKDAYDLLTEFIPSLRENVGQIQGVLGLETGDAGDYASYRVVMGNNIMPSLASDKGQYLMFNINTSEAGLVDTKTSLGLYRTFCTNSAIRVQTLSRWNHASAFEPFYDAAARTIRESGYLQDSYGKIFEALLRERLPFPAMDLLHAFKKEQLITPEHAEAALIHAETEPVETQYDLFNVITRSAQDMPSLPSRERAEEAAMKLFTEPGGVLEALRRAEAKPRKRRSGPLAELEGNGGEA